MDFIITWVGDEDRVDERPNSIVVKMDRWGGETLVEKGTGSQNTWEVRHLLPIYRPDYEADKVPDLITADVAGYTASDGHAVIRPYGDINMYYVYLTLTAKTEMDVSGRVTYVNGDLTSTVTAPPEVTVYRLRGDEEGIPAAQEPEKVELKNSRIVWEDGYTAYRFEKIDPDQPGDFPIYDAENHRYVYCIEAGDLTGYIDKKVEGFNITYTRTVSISGRVAWKDEKNPSNAQPMIQLLRDGEPVGSPVSAENFNYSFNDLPIAGEDGACYRYSVSATLDGYECFIQYLEVTRDANGCFTADAVILPKEYPVDVTIPLKLQLEGVDPASETEVFQFSLVSTSHEGFGRYVVTLGQGSHYEGSVTVKNIPELDTPYTFLLKQDNLDRHRNWVCDDKQQVITVTLRYLNGPAPIAEIDWGGGDAVTFTNVFHPDGAVVAIPAIKQIDNRLSGIETPEAQTFRFRLSAVHPDGTRDLVSYASIDREGLLHFPRIALTEAGQYTFAVTELGESPDGWSYDSADHRIDVTVTREGDQLKAIVGDAPVITNVFLTPVEDVPVSVVWQNNSKKPLPVPSRVGITLLADEQEYRRAEASEDGGWVCCFESVPLYRTVTRDASGIIPYTLTAQEV
ncbi:MAG: Cna B-type domain-containing protein [Clostridia bacterium]|nr:Cna B-type domain-containing protein [Clostridia bacterium]